MLCVRMHVLMAGLDLSDQRLRALYVVSLCADDEGGAAMRAAVAAAMHCMHPSCTVKVCRLQCTQMCVLE
jgi:hypothetical protein